jgi:endonuclease/exonuclease/phosphatase family metal-dependent hydrolase
VDHIFLSEGVKALNIEAPKTSLERMASDHLPLIANIRIEGIKDSRKNNAA